MAKISFTRGIGVLALLTILGVLALAGTSQAALLPTAPKAVCNPVSQVFLPWQDDAYYGLVPGGSFEGSLSGWQLSSGVGVVSGNETFHVTAPTDGKSLYLPSGTTVTTPPACFQFADWQLRLFARSTAGGAGHIRVRVIARGLLGGLLSSFDAGNVYTAADGSWQASDPIDIGLLTQLAGLLTSNSVSLQLTAVGGNFQIDDIYLDPAMGN